MTQIQELSNQIQQRLDQLGFAGDPNTRGNIIHHLAEFVVTGRRLAQKDIPAFLTLPPDDKEKLGELAVSIHSDLLELKQGLEDMQPALIQLMNFLTGT